MPDPRKPDLAEAPFMARYRAMEAELAAAQEARQRAEAEAARLREALSTAIELFAASLRAALELAPEGE